MVNFLLAVVSYTKKIGYYLSFSSLEDFTPPFNLEDFRWCTFSFQFYGTDCNSSITLCQPCCFSAQFPFLLYMLYSTFTYCCFFSVRKIHEHITLWSLITLSPTEAALHQSLVQIDQIKYCYFQNMHKNCF